MTPDKLATIAITLILAIPILLGFALASEEKEVDRETTTNRGSLTDAALNAQSPYFINYTGPNNNSMLQIDKYVSGDSETTVQSPEFVRTTSTYSTVPIYTTTSGTMDLSEVSSNQYEGGTSQTDYNYPPPTHTSYQYDVAQSLFFQVLSDTSKADPTATAIQAQPYMELQISGTYAVTIGGNTISTSGTLTIIKTGTADPFGLSNLIVILSDDAQYQGTIASIRLNGIGVDVYTSQLQPLSATDGFLMSFASRTPAVLVLDGRYYPLINETRASRLIYDSGEFVWFVNDVAYDNAINAYIAPGRNAGIKLATESGYGVGNIASGVTALPSFDYAYLYVLGTTATVFFDGSYYPVGAGSSSGFTLMKDSAAGWKALLNNGAIISSTTVTVKLTTGTLNVLHRDAGALSSNLDQWTADVSGTATVKITFSGGTTEYRAYPRIFAVTKSFDTVTVLSSSGTDTFASVSSVGLALSAGNTFVDYTTLGEITGYAQVAYGWRLPANASTTYTKWVNGYNNGYVRLIMQLAAGGDFYIYGDSQNQDMLLRIQSSSSGMMSVTIGTDKTARLGYYDNVMIEYDTSMGAITVSGIKEWPDMGAYPETLNQIVGAIDLEPTTGLYLAKVSGNPTLRVDAAKIQAGVFSTTIDYDMDLFDMFPDDDHQTLVLDSVGVYGSSLIIGGRTFEISAGNMIYDGETYRISGSKIDIVRDGDAFTFTVGKLTWEAKDGSIYFGGEWSMVLHRDVTTVETVKEDAWVAGKFALDKDGFILAMVLTAGAVFVVLGMWGARSGSKVAVLGIVCGVAVIIGLTLV